ncbi:hypothetical protein [Paracraurococcus ruber]|uniref:Uncharacterized protein n=1 Tax=Paracraurococcus ruber TaxID=77675 RepID=A0ABS1CRI9_9PROT|nr:hypothetical protein [Paracraurococcus ruber]MBK1656896.1 hypothetical protein [Paracraurococcus ruber]TDG33309.1 hypothetical protein E2C05_04270 [Paracraurococcus ruber]
MEFDDKDAALIARLAPPLRALHEANGGDWAGTLRDTLALMRETHRVEPRDGSDAGDSDTPDTPREDD